MTLQEALKHATLSPPDAGKAFFNLGRNASYEAVKRGDMPSIKIGGKIMVPVAPIAAQLGLTAIIGEAV